MMLKYWQNREAVRSRFANGWITRDLPRCDEDRHFWFHGFHGRPTISPRTRAIASDRPRLKAPWRNIEDTKTAAGSS
jgi:hypothetical protein